jgi:hypothetical protein
MFPWYSRRRVKFVRISGSVRIQDIVPSGGQIRLFCAADVTLQVRVIIAVCDSCPYISYCTEVLVAVWFERPAATWLFLTSRKLHCATHWVSWHIINLRKRPGACSPEMLTAQKNVQHLQCLLCSFILNAIILRTEC